MNSLVKYTRGVRDAVEGDIVVIADQNLAYFNNEFVLLDDDSMEIRLPDGAELEGTGFSNAFRAGRMLKHTHRATFVNKRGGEYGLRFESDAGHRLLSLDSVVLANGPELCFTVLSGPGIEAAKAAKAYQDDAGLLERANAPHSVDIVA